MTFRQKEKLKFDITYIDTSYLFSNGSEFEIWRACNCFDCNKYENKSTKIENAKCKAAFELDGSLGLGEMTTQALDYIGWNGDYKHPQLTDCTMKDFILKPVKVNTSVFSQKTLF
jgi:hypothetical protein